MSENVENPTTQETTAEAQAPEETSTAATDLTLSGLYAFKKGMTTVYSEDGVVIPVTVLEYEPMYVSQVKTLEKDGYEAVQVACRPKRAGRTCKAEKNHLAKAGFENGAAFVREIRQSVSDISVGQKVAVGSLVKGDKVKITGQNKGRGFSGSIKRWGFGGGPAAHGSGFHRAPGSIGNNSDPGRVMPGRKMPGQYGNETVSIRNVEVVDVLPEENVILVKGPVPGSKNSLVKLVKA